MWENMKYNLKKFNFIFTGHYLKIWYALFVLIAALMLFNSFRLRAVSEFDLTVYNAEGQIVSQSRVQDGEVPLLLDQLPVTKSFRPVK